MVLTSARLLLRELETNDVKALNEIERLEGVTRYQTFDVQTLEQTRVYVEGAVRQQAEVPRKVFDLAVVEREGGRFVGRCGLHVHRPDHKEAMVWYELHPDCWGQGYAREAVAAILGFGFDSLDLHRVIADCDPRNTASCRVAEKLGMTLEGRLRENYWLKGAWCDTAMYAILEPEWRSHAAR